MLENQQFMEDDEIIREEPDENRFLVFSVMDQSFAFEIDYVMEIIEVLPIVRVPSLPQSIRGVINLRGLIIPVIDLRLRFGYDAKDYDERTCIVVVVIDNMSVGIIVDYVEEIINISADNIMPPAADKFGIQSTRFVKGVGCENGGVQLILDCEKIIDLAGA